MRSKLSPLQLNRCVIPHQPQDSLTHSSRYAWRNTGVRKADMSGSYSLCCWRLPTVSGLAKEEYLFMWWAGGDSSGFVRAVTKEWAVCKSIRFARLPASS